MPKFDETQQHIDYDGDEYIIESGCQEPLPCCVSGDLTPFVSINFIAPICSTECADIEWDNFANAVQKSSNLDTAFSRDEDMYLPLADDEDCFDLI